MLGKFATGSCTFPKTPQQTITELGKVIADPCTVIFEPGKSMFGSQPAATELGESATMPCTFPKMLGKLPAKPRQSSIARCMFIFLPRELILELPQLPKTLGKSVSDSGKLVLELPKLPKMSREFTPELAQLPEIPRKVISNALQVILVPSPQPIMSGKVNLHAPQPILVARKVVSNDRELPEMPPQSPENARESLFSPPQLSSTVAWVTRFPQFRVVADVPAGDRRWRGRGNDQGRA
jgi:hypothetical protein